MDKSAPFTSQVQHDLEKLRLYFNDKSTTANRDDIVTLAQLIQPVAGECPQIDTVLSLIPMVFYVSKAPDSNLLIEPLRARFTDLKGKGAIYTTVRLMLLDCLIALKDKSQVSETLEIYASEQEQDLKDWSQRCLRKMGYELPFEEEKPQPKSSTAKP